MSNQQTAGPAPVAPTVDQEKSLTRWRALALDQMPYMASMLFALRCSNLPGLGTFAVDRRMRLYVDFDAIAADPDTWTDILCSQALLHECCHLFNDHAGRAHDAGVTPADCDRWGLAADAEINDDLRDAGCRELVDFGVLPKDLGQRDHMCAEQYYRSTPPAPPSPAAPVAGSPSGVGEPYDGCGTAAGGSPIPGAPDDGDNPTDADGPAGPGASPVEVRRVRIATAASIRQHTAVAGRGSVPGGLLDRAAQTLAPPVVPWQQVLRADLAGAAARQRGQVDADWHRRSRRRRDVRVGRGLAVYPGSYSPQPRIAAVRDTSGSMSGADLAAVTNEIVGIAAALGIRGRDLRVLDVDAQVHEVVDYHGRASVSQVHGRGGTDMRVGIAAAAELQPRPGAIVVLTDGDTPWPDQPCRVPVIACVVGPSTQSVPPWIRVVRIPTAARSE
jgi:predicted metal-dependent peptidase